MQFVRSELQKDQELHDTKDRVSSLVAKATPARVGSSPNGGSGKENIGKRENKNKSHITVSTIPPPHFMQTHAD